MLREVQDTHVCQLKFVTEASPASGKYKRVSIPNLESRHCLGYLEGPAASLTTATRNDRKYPLLLWQRVEDSADFQEGMECAVIVGELDHPPERVDYSLSNGAVILTDWEIREDEGILWCRFAILDTPEGRKVMAYVNFGTVLGVSSRGLGDEVILNGETCIDPETYEFYCFDVVAFPAVKSARQSFVNADGTDNSLEESVARKDKFVTVLTEQVAKAQSKEELQTIRNVIESTNVPDKASLVESISNKLSSLSESTDDQSNTREEEPAEDTEKQVLLGSIAEKDTALNNVKDELDKAKDLLHRRGVNANYFRKVVQEQREEINALNGAVEDCLKSVTEVSEQCESAASEIMKLKEELNTSETELLECRKSANAYKRSSERKIEALSKEISRYRKSLKEARASRLSSTKLVENLNASLKNEQDAKIKIEKQLATEVATSTSALRESRKASEKDAASITMLENQVKELEAKIEALQNESSSAKSKLHESVNKTKEHKEQTVNVLNGYLRKCCEAYGIDYTAARQKLPKEFTMADADKVVNELADRQARFDMLPITLSPVQGRIVEHVSKNTENESPSFVVEALKRGQ